MAICNNLGHCCAHLMDSASVNMCRNEVRHTLETYWDEIEEDSVFDEEFEYFHYNLLFCKQNFVTILLSPAA